MGRHGNRSRSLGKVATAFATATATATAFEMEDTSHRTVLPVLRRNDVSRVSPAYTS